MAKRKHFQIHRETKYGIHPQKLVYLIYLNTKKWTMPLANYTTISQQLAIKFGERFKLL